MNLEANAEVVEVVDLEPITIGAVTEVTGAAPAARPMTPSFGEPNPGLRIGDLGSLLGAALARCLDGERSARVMLTHFGVVGNSGMQSPHYVYTLDGPSRCALHSLGADVRRCLLSREASHPRSRRS